jgi:hypothetical protein
MKTSDLQQMMQRYKLIVEENKTYKDEYDKLIEDYSSIKYKYDETMYRYLNAAFEMRQFMSTDEYQFGASTDWMGSRAAEVRERGGPPLPPTYDEWVEQTLDEIRQGLTFKY